MGFKSFFSRKKKPLQSAAAASASPIASRSQSMSVQYRAQHVEELKQVFKRFDVNGDGKISASELGSIMGSLGEPATEEEIQNMIREADADGDGFISLEEFIELNTKGVDYMEEMENLKDAFSVFDIDGNGKISAEELQMVMKSLNDDCSLAECRRMIQGADHDGDGQIDFEEFKVMMMLGSRHDTSDRVKTE